MRVKNLINGLEIYLRPWPICNMNDGPIEKPQALYLVTNRKSGLAPVRFEVMTCFVLFSLFYIDFEYNLRREIKFPHQIELLSGDRVFCNQIHRALDGDQPCITQPTRVY